MNIPIGLFLFTLFFYLRTLCATFNINDSGETIMDCNNLAIAHAPGYPLHTLLGRIFCLLPLGQPMFRLTFASAVMGALATVMVYLVLRKILKNIPTSGQSRFLVEIPALFAALCFAFSYQQWFQSCGAKGSIYMLNILLSITLVFLLLKMREEGGFVKGFFLSVFLFGLGLANHWPNQVVMAPSFFILLLAAQNRVPGEAFLKNLLRPFDQWANLRKAAGSLSAASLVRSLAFLLLPLSVYCYLPLRAVQKPAINWFDPRTFKTAVFVILRGNYAGIGDPRSWTTVTRNLARFWFHASHQWGEGFTFAVFLLAGVGLVWLWKRWRMDALGLFLFGFGVFAGVLFFNNPKAGYEWTDDNFFTPVFLAVSLFAGVGLSALLARLSRISLGVLRPIYLGAACLGMALLPLGLNFGGNDQSAYTGSYEEGLNLLRTVDRNGVILCNGDIDILPLWYLQLVEGKRPEVASFTTQFVGMQWYREGLENRWPYLKTALQGDWRPDLALAEIVREHGVDRSFYTTNIYFPGGSDWLARAYPWVPDGVLYRMANSRNQGYAFNTSRVNQLWARYETRNLDPPERKYWDEYSDVMKDAYGQGCSFTGDVAMAAKSPQTAQWCYEKALQYRQPQQMGVTYLKLGDAELALGQTGEAISHYQLSLQGVAHYPSVNYVYAPYAYAKLGQAFLLEKDYVDAGEAFQTSLRLNPRQKEALDGLQWLNKARGGDSGGQSS